MHRPQFVQLPLIPIALFLALALPASAQEDAVAEIAARFDITEVMIPARDGVTLHTRIFGPKERTAPLPFILIRTPYGIEESEWNFVSYLKELTEEGYIFVFQDIRGRYGSEGAFMMLRPACQTVQPHCIDEGTDTYDTIEWLLRNVPDHNGRVGMLGISYDGWTTAMALLEPHPALRAASPQASPADMWLGDDFHHNGAFRLSYGFEYAAMMETPEESEDFSFDRHDTYDWYLSLGPLSTVNEKYLGGRIPTWNDFVEHPDWDEFWQQQTLIPAIDGVEVPTLNVAGWWDQEDFYGPVRIYEELEKHDERELNFLVVGPWDHGGWASGEGDQLGDISFNSPTARYFRESVQAPWFAYWLKDKGEMELPEALTFEAGSNQWRWWDAWPPTEGIEARNLYFHTEGKLSFERPVIAEGFDTYVSDPAHPVPYRHRPIEATYFPEGSEWWDWLLEDQRFVDDRPDVLSWESEVLTEDVTIAGEVMANLFVATTGTDADFVVKLIDVYPEQNAEDWKLSGWQLMVSNEVFRARYRNSFERPEPLPADQVISIAYSLHTQNYTFRKGHRVMVQVQSTWFPLIDRNPQTFVPNIFKARESDYRSATIRVHRSAQHPSHVTVPVVVTPGP